MGSQRAHLWAASLGYLSCTLSCLPCPLPLISHLVISHLDNNFCIRIPPSSLHSSVWLIAHFQIGILSLCWKSWISGSSPKLNVAWCSYTLAPIWFNSYFFLTYVSSNQTGLLVTSCIFPYEPRLPFLCLDLLLNHIHSSKLGPNVTKWSKFQKV